jgi:hypothetical protein
MILFTSLTSFAQAQEVTFSGYGAAGYRILDREALLDANQEPYYEGKLQADIRISKLIEGQLDFRADSRDKRVELREFTAKIELADWVDMKIGNTKKPFGREQMFDQYEMETIDRSFIHRSLSPLGYVDRGVSIMLQRRYKEKKDSGSIPLSYQLSFFKDNSLSYGVVGRVTYHMNSDWALSASVEKQQFGWRESISALGFAADLSYDTKEMKASIEGVMAEDPIEGVRLHEVGIRENVYSAGAKLNASMNFDLGGELFRSIEPVILVGWFAPNTGQIKARTIQALAGVNVYIHKHARFRVNVDKLDTRGVYSTVSSSHDSRITLEFQLKY